MALSAPELGYYLLGVSVWLVLSSRLSSVNYTADLCKRNAAENHMLAIRVGFFVLGHGAATHQCIKVCPPGLWVHSSGTQLIHYEVTAGF